MMLGVWCIPSANYHRPADQQEPHKKACLLTKCVGKVSGKRSGEWIISQKKMTRTKKSKWTIGIKTREQNKKWEINDSPDIPDRRLTSDNPDLSSDCVVE